jgi:hypothetical protein
MAYNCYAHACKCTNPNNGKRGQVVPGGYAGNPVFQAGGETADELAARYVQGVQADIDANGIAGTIHEYDQGPPAPPNPGAGNYLIAMVTKVDGFHFFRRDTNGLWSWKDGNAGSITGQATKIRKVLKNKLCDVNDVVLLQMLTNNNAYIPNWATWTFRAYIELPTAGMTVAGDTSP